MQKSVNGEDFISTFSFAGFTTVIINFNAQDQMATLYTRDPAVMRKVDALVIDYPDTFTCIGETDIDKTYEMPKSAVTYRKPRRLSEEQRSRTQAYNETK